MHPRTRTANFLLVVWLAFAMSLSVMAQDEENILTNPDFETGTNGWSLSGGFGTLTIDDKEESPTGTPVLMATINAVGVENWEPEVHSPSFSLKNGETYTYAFWAKAEEWGKRIFALEEPSDPMLATRKIQVMPPEKLVSFLQD